ncbi:MAG TPA: methionyl-tRNA formyltransferase, partial [Actinomycetota bacterium]|nr:methionyl-tRNA formyltransferase [Actinomycetota bacterium]
MRVTFLGNAPPSVSSLEAVAASSHEISLVATRVARPAGRGSALVRTPVAEAAERLGLPLVETETVKSGGGFTALRASEPDVLAVVAYGEILPEEVLEMPTIAPVNVHFSLLPRLRGAAPVQRAIMEGAQVTGVTTIRMDAGMDTGPVLLQAEEPIRDDDDAGTLGERLAALGGRVLVETLDGLGSGAIEEQPQDDAGATYAPKVKAEDRIIDWHLSAEEVARLIRAMAPEPGAQTTFREKILKVFRASAAGDSLDGRTGRAGEIVVASNEGFAAATGRGILRLDDVAPEGRKRMSGADFVRGYRPEVGEILGP